MIPFTLNNLKILTVHYSLFTVIKKKGYKNDKTN